VGEGTYLSSSYGSTTVLAWMGGLLKRARSVSLGMHNESITTALRMTGAYGAGLAGLEPPLFGTLASLHFLPTGTLLANWV
jgi:hypothetical protein